MKAFVFSYRGAKKCRLNRVVLSRNLFMHVNEYNPSSYISVGGAQQCTSNYLKRLLEQVSATNIKRVTQIDDIHIITILSLLFSGIQVRHMSLVLGPSVVSRLIYESNPSPFNFLPLGSSLLVTTFPLRVEDSSSSLVSMLSPPCLKNVRFPTPTVNPGKSANHSSSSSFEARCVREFSEVSKRK